MDKTTRESGRQGPGFLRGWLSASDSQQHTDKQSDESSRGGNSPRSLRFWVQLLLLIFLINLFFFQEALDKLLLGGKREVLMDERERRIVAYHEGGHALVAAVLPDVDPLYKVTIVPRGRSLGVTQFLPEDDRRNYPRSYLLERLAVALGGRTGEEVALGEITSGAENDLKEATKLARRMVTEWGMGEQTGVVANDLEGESPFLGQQLMGEPSRLYSEVTAERVDAEVERLLEQAHQQARTVLSEHRAALDCLTQTLLQEEVLERDQVLAIVAGAQTIQGSAVDGESNDGKPTVGVEH